MHRAIMLLSITLVPLGPPPRENAPTLTHSSVLSLQKEQLSLLRKPFPFPWASSHEEHAEDVFVSRHQDSISLVDGDWERKDFRLL
jgi:hypothetical protein